MTESAGKHTTSAELLLWHVGGSELNSEVGWLEGIVVVGGLITAISTVLLFIVVGFVVDRLALQIKDVILMRTYSLINITTCTLA